MPSLRRSAGASVVAIVTLVVLSGCGETAPVAPEPEPPGALSVAGSYSIAQMWVEEGCGESGNLPTLAGRVDHNAGATRFQMLAGQAGFAGSVEPDGDFRIDPVAFAEADGAQSTITLEGSFQIQGFTAELTLATDRSASGGESCNYRIGWTAVLQAGRNVIPG